MTLGFLKLLQEKCTIKSQHLSNIFLPFSCLRSKQWKSQCPPSLGTILSKSFKCLVQKSYVGFSEETLVILQESFQALGISKNFSLLQCPYRFAEIYCILTLKILHSGLSVCLFLFLCPSGDQRGSISSKSVCS